MRPQFFNVAAQSGVKINWSKSVCASRRLLSSIVVSDSHCDVADVAPPAKPENGSPEKNYLSLTLTYPDVNPLEQLTAVISFRLSHKCRSYSKGVAEYRLGQRCQHLKVIKLDCRCPKESRTRDPIRVCKQGKLRRWRVADAAMPPPPPLPPPRRRASARVARRGSANKYGPRR